MFKYLLFVLVTSIWIINVMTLQSGNYDSTHVRTWSTWYDTDSPTSGDGDDETVSSIRKRGYEVCDGHSPIDAICRLANNHLMVFNSENLGYVPDSLHVPCTTLGLECRNGDQTNTCRNYQIRFECLSPTSGSPPENLGIIGTAAGLSVIVPILCVAIMHVVRYIRDRRRPTSQTLVRNTEQSVQTDSSDLPPSYSFLFGSPDASDSSSSSSSPTGHSYRLSITDSSGNLSVPSTRLASPDLPSVVDGQSSNDGNGTNGDVNEPSTSENQTRPNWRSRFPNMHLSIFDLFSSMGQRSPAPQTPQSPDLSYIQTPPPTYIDAILIVGAQNEQKEDEKQET